MVFLTGYHRTGTSAIYYDLCSRARSIDFIPPARPLAKLINIFCEDMEDGFSFYPQRTGAQSHQSNVIMEFIHEVYGRGDRVFLKCTDFIFFIPYLLTILQNLYFIVVIRDPLPTISSLYGAQKAGYGNSHNGTDLVLKIANEYCNVYNSLMFLDENKLDKIFWIKFEDYCKNPTTYLKSLTNFCELEFHKVVSTREVEKFYQEYKSYTSVMRQHDYWKNYITDYTGEPITSIPSKRSAAELENFDRDRVVDFLYEKMHPKLVRNGLVSLDSF